MRHLFDHLFSLFPSLAVEPRPLPDQVPHSREKECDHFNVLFPFFKVTSTFSYSLLCKGFEMLLLLFVFLVCCSLIMSMPPTWLQVTTAMPKYR